MPIRPELRHFYQTPEYKAARERIVERAGNKCEQCGAPNRKTVLRLYGWWTEATVPATVWAMKSRFRFDVNSTIERDGAVIETIPNQQFIKLPWNHATPGGPMHSLFCSTAGGHRWVGIVLTCAHLDHDPANNADENLKLLCQWCHLNYDQLHHKETRSIRKDRQRPILTPDTREPSIEDGRMLRANEKRI